MASEQDHLDRMRSLIRQVENHDLAGLNEHWVGEVRELPNADLPVMLAKLRRDQGHSGEGVETARRTIEAVLSERLAAQQIEAAEQLSERAWSLDERGRQVTLWLQIVVLIVTVVGVAVAIL